MQSTFHPVPTALAAVAPQSAVPGEWRPVADRFGEEPRTAGPSKIPYRPPADKPASTFGMALRESQAPAAPSSGPDFGDFLDMINPLQHIPLVNLVYRGLTGDTIGGAAQVVGGALYGGPIGAVAGVASAIVEHQTGHSVTDTALAALSGRDLPPVRPDIALSASEITKRYNFNLQS